jgi:glycosyltransferase involved in cell wall biosynthesis
MSYRFCMVTTFYPPYNFGGDGVYVRRLTNALAERGHEVHVVHDVDAYRLMAGSDPQGDYTDHEAVVHHGLRRGAGWRVDLVAAHQAGRPLATRRRMEELLDGPGFDVVHFHNISLIGGPGVLRFGGGVKLCTMHDYWFICPMHTLWRMDREACASRTCLRCTLRGLRPPQLWRRTGALGRAAGEVDAFIVPSDFSRRTHLANGLAGQRIVELPNFAPEVVGAPDPLAPERHREPAARGERAAVAPGQGGERPFFLAVGRLERLKGFQDLIDAFRAFDRADLLIAGSGSYEEELRRRARGLDHVRFSGWMRYDELDRLYRRAVAVAVPSLCYESAFPLVGIEAFAVGTPVIVRRHGALEQVERMGGGWVFGSHDELVRSLETALDDVEGHAAHAATARRLFEERYSEAVHLERYLDLVQGIRRAKSPGAVT